MAEVETPFDIMGLEDDDRDQLLDMPQSKVISWTVFSSLGFCFRLITIRSRGDIIHHSNAFGLRQFVILFARCMVPT